MFYKQNLPRQTLRSLIQAFRVPWNAEQELLLFWIKSPLIDSLLILLPVTGFSQSAENKIKVLYKQSRRLLSGWRLSYSSYTSYHVDFWLYLLWLQSFFKNKTMAFRA